MTDALLPLAICVAIGLLWYDALRARELAIAHALRLCARHGAQLLDQSVALHRLQPLWRDRPQLARSYRFELSYAGNDRHRASLTLVGERLIDYSLPAREDETLTATPQAVAAAIQKIGGDVGAPGKVVSIKQGRRTLH